MEKDEIQESLMRNHSAFTEFLKGLTDVVARNSLPGKWTPNQQLDHIVKSVKPVKFAFSLPKFLIPLFFGRSKNPSRTYDQLVADYKARLAAGAKSTARFLPDSSCDRMDLINVLEKHVQGLTAKIDRYTEKELDEFTLPHPLLGRITMREMLYFTIYHVEHHHLQVNLNMSRSLVNAAVQ